MDGWIGGSICGPVDATLFSCGEKVAKLLIYQSNYISSLTFSHELWVLIEKTTLRKRVKMSFLRRVSGLTLRDLGEDLSLLRRIQSGTTAPLHQEWIEAVEVFDD